MFVNNFLAPIQVRLSPNFVSHTLGCRGRDYYILEGQGERSRSVGKYALSLSSLTNVFVLC